MGSSYNPTDSMSPSKFKAAATCGAKFLFRYVAPREDRATSYSASLQWGAAFDQVGNAVYTDKHKTGETPPVRDVQERFAAEWDWASDGVDLWMGRTKGDLLDVGTKAAALWRDRIALHFTPTGLQERLEVDVTDPATREVWKLVGVVDAADRGTVHGTPVVIDLKTTGRRYQVNAFAREVQPAAYTLLTGIPNFEYHILLNTKTPDTQVLRAELPDSERDSFLLRASILRRQIQHSIRTGDWFPNRAATTCSRRYCEHWRACEHRFGGTVPE